MSGINVKFLRRNFLSLFALLALMCQGMIPAGSMPDFSAHKAGFALTICTGSGSHVIIVDADRYDPASAPRHAPQPDHGKMPPCPYAAFASLLTFGGHAHIALPVFVPRAVTPPAPQTTLASSQRFFGNAGPRAPPV